MAAIASLGVSVGARTASFSRGMRKMRGELVLTRTSVTALGRAAAVTSAALTRLWASAAGPAALLLAFGKLLSAGEAFNRSMRNSLAIMGEVSEAMKRQMAAVALDVAKTTQFAAREAAEAYFFLASAGLDAAQSIKALPAVAKFAQAGMFGLALATDLLTDAQSALGLSSSNATKNLEEMVRVSDVLVKANTIANASVQQFSEALTNKAGAKMKALNIDLEEGVAVLAAFADQGLKASDAGTAFSIVVRDLTTKAIKNKQAFEEAGVAVFDSTGRLRNLADIIADLEGLLDGMSNRLQKATLLQLGFTDKSVGFQQALLGSSEKIREYEEALRAASGITDKVAGKQLTQFAKGWENVAAAFVTVADKLQPVVDGLGLLMRLVGGLVGGLAKIPDALFELLGPDEGKLPNITFQAEQALAAIDAAKKAQEAGGAEAAGAASRRREARERAAASTRRRSDEASQQRRALQLSVRTPQKVFQQELNRLNRLFDSGARDAETYHRAVAKLREEFEGGAKRLASLTSSIDSIVASLETPVERMKKLFLVLLEGVKEGVLTLRQAAEARARLLEQLEAGRKRADPRLGQGGLRSLSEVGGVAGAKALAASSGRKSKELEELKKQTAALKKLVTGQRAAGGLAP